MQLIYIKRSLTTIQFKSFISRRYVLEHQSVPLLGVPEDQQRASSQLSMRRTLLYDHHLGLGQSFHYETHRSVEPDICSFHKQRKYEIVAPDDHSHHYNIVCII